jgi:hypothetical protein
MPLTLSPTIRSLEGILINSAQLVRKQFKYLGFCDSKMAPDETPWGFSTKATGKKVSLR